MRWTHVIGRPTFFGKAMALERILAASQICERDDEIVEYQVPVACESCSWGIQGQLKPHQAEGVAWLIRRYVRGVNVILGDEMGLGKTLQAIAFLAYLKAIRKSTGPFCMLLHVILCPLSVVDGWVSEFAKFAPTLKLLKYVGGKDERENIQKHVSQHVNSQPAELHSDPTMLFDVLLTTYDLAMSDGGFLSRMRWRYAIIDEAQRLKNSSSKLYEMLAEKYILPRRLLLTGTPIQNNVSELWALLHFCMPLVFRELQEFLDIFANSEEENKHSTKFVCLRRILHAFMMRRTKATLVHNRVLELPPLSEVTLCVPMLPLQRQVYVTVLKKEVPKLGAPSQLSLPNTIVQLRKACSHPYLFDGIEPEPFEEGEHLVQASGKLLVLDVLLRKINAGNHRALIFAQMTRTLDILQDYLDYRKYSYERLDGSIRAEERFAAVRNFSSTGNPHNTPEPFVFLLTTRAGGVGLNLTAADTVIFYEQDWNPQADRQALQRAHRIGQNKPVLAMSLITEHTVEEVIMCRANKKLELTHEIMGHDGADEPDEEQDPNAATSSDLESVIMYGLSRLRPEVFEVENKATFMNGKHLAPHIENMVEVALAHRGKHDLRSSFGDVHRTTLEGHASDNIYKFEGQDFSVIKHAGKVEKDVDADKMIYETLASNSTDSTRSNGKRRLAEVSDKEREEKRAKRCEKAEQARMKKWEALGYKSLAINDHRDDLRSFFFDEATGGLHFMIGDCTKPKTKRQHEGAIILTCVDNSGEWGAGGMFKALGHLSQKVPDVYAAAHEASDLHLEDVHLLDLSGDVQGVPIWVALAVVQTYDRRRKVPRSALSLAAFDNCLRKVVNSAVAHNASVHLPRISGGHTEDERKEWYSMERILRKHATASNIPFYVYYFKRNVGESEN